MTRAATLFLVVATCLVVAALVTGFTLIPTPAQQRTLDIDAKRARALDLLGFAVTSYASANGKLPESLDELAQANQQARDNMNDVETGRPYEYLPGEGFHYRLCATFGAPTPPGTSADFRHPAGHACTSKRVK